MSKPKILYIGNDLAKKTKYNTSMQTLYELLKKEKYIISKSSSEENTILRLLYMIVFILKNTKTNYILIDTFSTSAFYYCFIISQIARFFKIKYIPILHGGNLPSRLVKTPKMCKMIFANSYKNIAPSNYLKTAFEKKGYKTMFIPNILEINDYQFKKREKIQPKLLWVRAFKHLYNPILAIEVLKLLKEKYPTASLCMVGPKKDSSYQEVLNLIKKYNLENSVKLTGVLPKKEWHKISTEYDVFINTTNFDNTPVSVMEAMALGLSIVSTNVGGMPFLVKNGVDGVLVDKENPQQMVNEIIKLVKTNDNKFVKNARKKAESFGWGVVKEKWLQILK